MMPLNNFLREYWPAGCYLFKRMTQLRKKIYLNLFCQPSTCKIPFLSKFSYQKKSDTLFILGSGASVLDLSPEDWALIKQHDSVGFNLWLVHDFVPDLYMFEVADRDADSEFISRSHDFFYNLRMKEKDYSNVKMIYKMNTVLSRTFLLEKCVPKSILKNFYFSPVIFLAHHDLKTLKKMLKISLRALEKNKNWIHLHTHATMFDLILFAVKYQFKKIVLVGTDLTADYFFETNYYKEYLLSKNLKPPCSIVTPGEKKSGINGIESWFTVPMSVILDEIDKMTLTPKGIQLYVASQKSRLYPRFPLYFFNTGLG